VFAFGLVGIFVGPVVLAVAWTLLEAWLGDGDEPAVVSTKDMAVLAGSAGREAALAHEHEHAREGAHARADAHAHAHAHAHGHGHDPDSNQAAATTERPRLNEAPPAVVGKPER
jgi:ABC-type Zn2+ transport system substrate-binding protein/surface adhesin